jgi:short-subunit dehydrogenase
VTPETDGPLAVRYGPSAVIAGASEGIGEALAGRLAAAGIDLVLIARNESRLRAVAAGIKARHGRDARVLPLDLTAPGMHQAVARLSSTASDPWPWPGCSAQRCSTGDGAASS